MPSSGWSGLVGVPGGIPTSYTLYANVLTGVGITTPTTWVSGTTYGANAITSGGSYVTDPANSNWYLCILGTSGTTNPNADPTHWTQIAKQAVGDGVADDQPIIEYAVLTCPNTKYVYIPTGSYKLGAPIARKGLNLLDNVQRPFSIEIRGDGPTLTKLYGYGSGSIIVFTPGNAAARTMVISSGNARGSTSLVLATFDNYFTSLLKYMVVRRLDSDVEASDGVPYEASYMIDSASQIVQISSLNSGTKTVTFTPALNDAFSGDYIAIDISNPYRCGVRDLFVENMTDNGAHSIDFQNAQECWLVNVESYMASRWHVRFLASTRCEARENVIHDGYTAGGDHDYGIGLYQFGSNNLVENNIFYLTRHAMPMEYGGQGNVYGYNYSFNPVNSDNGPILSTTYLMGDALNHGGAMHYNLWEGNVNATLRWDCVLGSGRWTTAFRNQIQRKGLAITIIANFGSDVQKWNYDANLTGNCYELPPPSFAGALRRWGTNQDGAQTSAITAATNASPIAVTVSTAPSTDFYQTGDYINISGVVGNTAANGAWQITRVDGTHFTLQTSTGNGTYVSGGTVTQGIDPRSQSSANVDGEYDLQSNTTTWAGADHSLPNSYYLSAKPSWWDAGAWPAVGPDLGDMFGENPAYRRWFSGIATATGNPGSLSLLISF